MATNIRRLNPPLRLNERVLRPVRHLARMAGVTPEEIIESLLEEIFEGDIRPAPPRHRTPARIIPIRRDPPVRLPQILTVRLAPAARRR